MSETPESRADASGIENHTPDPSKSTDLVKKSSEALLDQQTLTINAANLPKLQHSTTSQVDEFNKLSPQIQRILVQEFEADMQDARARKGCQQQIDLILDILKLLFAFILALVLIVGSIQTIHAGHSVDGLLQGIGAAVASIVGVFLVRNVGRRIVRIGQSSNNGPPAS